MSALKSVIFYFGLGALFTHELDAMANHEWRVLPLVRALPDETAMMVFIALHVPLFAVVIALVASSHAQTRRISRLAVGAFLVIHGALHALFADHPNYEFASLTSQLLIFGGAGLGAGYLVLAARMQRSN